MKAIILERRGDYAAVLCEDGTFVKTRRGGEIGETIELEAEVVAFPTKKKNRWARNAVAAALVLAVTGSTLGYTTASAYVSLDVEDSSIELTVNHFGRVIAVNAVSEDAEELAASLSGEVKHRRVEDALDHTMERLRDEGYLDDADTAVIAGVTSDNSKRSAELKQSVENAVGDRQTLYVSESSRAERAQAKEQKVSAGRFAFEHGGEIAPAMNAGAVEVPNDPAEQAESAVPAGGTETAGTAEASQPYPAGPPAQETPAERPEEQQNSGNANAAIEGPQQESDPSLQTNEPIPQDERTDERPEQLPQNSGQPEQMLRDSGETDRQLPPDDSRTAQQTGAEPLDNGNEPQEGQPSPMASAERQSQKPQNDGIDAHGAEQPRDRGAQEPGQTAWRYPTATTHPTSL